MQRHVVLSGGRYPVLRSLAILYVLGAALTVLATIAGILWIFAKAPGTAMDHAIMSIGAITAGFFVVVSMLAVAEVLKLFIDVEHNTRTGGAGARGMVVETPTSTVVVSGGDGRTNRLDALDEETAEAALLRGH